MSPKKIARPLDIYVRVSDVRGRGGDSFISPKDQEERCRALAKARGFQIGEVFKDLDVSGGKMRRPELDSAIERIGEGVSAGIIVAKLDRFARTLVGGLQTLEQINGLGGVVIVADGEFDTSTATGELVLNMMLSLAQFELRRIRDNWATAKRHAVVENGIHISRHVPAGYSRGKDRRLVPDPEWADTITEAFAMAAAGDSYTHIADYLSDHGIPTYPNRVKRLLANRVYLGEARNGHGDVNAAAHEPLVDPATWNLAQRDRQTGPTLTRSTGSLLSGLARCASCSYAMRPQKPRQGKRGMVVGTYRCGAQAGECPQPTTVSMDRLDDYVIEQFLAAAGRLTMTPAHDDQESAAAAEAIVQAERSYRRALTDVSLREQIGDADHGQMVASLHARWQELLAAAPVPTGRMQPLGDAIDLAALVSSLREEGAIDQLRDLLGSTVAAVFVRPSATRARGVPLGYRVKVVFHGEESLTLPRRGESFQPQAYAW